MLSLWSYLLFAGAVVGALLLWLVLTGKKGNPAARLLFAGLLLVMIAGNLDNWLFASGLWQIVPHLHGFSRGSVLLLGPVFLLYARSITDDSFRLRPVHLLHALPFLLVYATLIPQIYLVSAEEKLEYIQYSYNGGGVLGNLQRGIFLGYLIQLTIYVGMTFRLFRENLKAQTGGSLLVPFPERIGWLRTLGWCFFGCYASLVLLLGWTLLAGVYQPVLNYVLTMVYSAITYFVGFRLVRREALVLADFTRKYQSLSGTADQRLAYRQKFEALIRDQRAFLDPNLTLSKVASTLGIPAGYLSRLLNEEYETSFPDYINAFRVEEVKARLRDPASSALSLLGLALESGFNSKSAFNAAFKKATGQTPSEFKRG